MKPELPRRRFLQASLAAATPWSVPLRATAATAQPQPTSEAEQLTAYQVAPKDPQIWIRWTNRLLTSYRAHPTQKYPYLYPLAGPVSGLSLTTETSEPYPHHRSLFLGCDHVNGGNYWHGTPQTGHIVSTGPTLGDVSATSAQILDHCQWRQADGAVVCDDRRRITVTVRSPRLSLLDCEIRWTAVQPLTIAPTNHSLFSLRAAGDITPQGGGTLINSEGQVGEKATFGQPAAWCSFHGRRKDVPGRLIEGIALGNHPANPWPDCPWFTRDYGFVSPTPMFFRRQPWQLAAGQTVTLRYLVVLHAGDPKQAQLDALYRTWAAGS